jgi:hypothetical protein
VRPLEEPPPPPPQLPSAPFVCQNLPDMFEP